jgi:hypothetical protein
VRRFLQDQANAGFVQSIERRLSSWYLIESTRSPTPQLQFRYLRIHATAQELQPRARLFDGQLGEIPMLSGEEQRKHHEL